MRVPASQIMASGVRLACLMLAITLPAQCFLLSRLSLKSTPSSSSHTGAQKQPLAMTTRKTSPLSMIKMAEGQDGMVAMQNTNMNQYPWLRKQREGDSFEFVFPSTVTVEPMSPEESDKSLLIFLPGIDGVGWFAEPQFEDLARNFELRCFQLFKNDRSDFDALVHAVAAFIKDWQVARDARHTLCGVP